jgi:hypothetical protein
MTNQTFRRDLDAASGYQELLVPADAKDESRLPRRPGEHGGDTPPPGAAETGSKIKGDRQTPTSE